MHISFFFLSLCGCTQKIAHQEVVYPELKWPVGADVSRIQFIQHVSRPEDLQITSGFFAKIWDYITGEGEKYLVSPINVEVDLDGRLFVVDSYWKAVLVFDRTAHEFYVFPEEENALLSPVDIAIDNERNRLFVTDSAAGAIRVFKDGGKKESAEIGKDELERPTGITINAASSELLVVDTGQSKVFRYRLSDLATIGSFGTRGSGRGEFNYPTYVCTGSDGRIFVTDSLNFRVQAFSAQGDFLFEFGEAGNMPGFFSRPKGIEVDSDNNVYVVDALFDAVQMFSEAGELLMDFGGPGQDFGKFWLPHGIFIDNSDRIYVADTYNKRVQIFQYLHHD